MSDGNKRLSGVFTVPVIVQKQLNFNDSIFAWEINLFCYLSDSNGDRLYGVNKLPEGRNYT